MRVLVRWLLPWSQRLRGSSPAASDTVLHGTWILVAGALGLLTVSAVAVPSSPVRHWVTCHLTTVINISGQAATTPTCPAAISGPPTYPSASASGFPIGGWQGDGYNVFTDPPNALALPVDAQATFQFTVASGQSSTLTYGTPTGDFLNTGNDLTIQSIDEKTDTYFAPYHLFATATGTQKAARDTADWSQTFGPGSYVIEFTNNSANPGLFYVYGLWASNPQAISS